MKLPKYDEIQLPALKLLSDGNEWKAKDANEMYDFMKNLFGLVELSVEKFATEIAKYLNISFDADSYRVHWNLLSIEAVKNDPN
jgi:hypothetical protein